MNTMWTTHLRAAPVPLFASPKQPQRLLRPLAGGFLRHSKRISALSCSIVFFPVLQQVPTAGAPHARQQKKPRTNRGFLNISLQQQQNTIWTLPWR